MHFHRVLVVVLLGRLHPRASCPGKHLFRLLTMRRCDQRHLVSPGLSWACLLSTAWDGRSPHLGTGLSGAVRASSPHCTQLPFISSSKLDTGLLANSRRGPGRDDRPLRATVFSCIEWSVTWGAVASYLSDLLAQQALFEADAARRAHRRRQAQAPTVWPCAGLRPSRLAFLLHKVGIIVLPTWKCKH